VIFKQYRHEPAGQASYVVGCSEAREALVVDPIADLGPDFYLLEAAELGVSLVGVLETHVHADYISCARDLAALLQVPHHLHESLADRARYRFSPLADKQLLTVGRLQIEVIHTPGHTPEHVSYLVSDTSRGQDPWFVLSGDSLLVGDVGRPDLLLGDEALDVIDEEERAAAQYRSITERLFVLPDHVEVYPNHYGGSSCGGVNLSGKASSTIGMEKMHNLPLRQPDAGAFAGFVRETSRPMPPDYRRIKAINLGLLEKPASRDEPGLTPQAAQAEIAGGAVALDVRPPQVFALGHLPGALNLQFNRADLADRAALALPPALEMIVIGDSDAVALEATDLLREAGFKVQGHLGGGLDAWKAAGRPVERVRTITVDYLKENLAAYRLVDAREKHEYRRGHVEGALLLPSGEAWQSAEKLAPGVPVAVYCADQARSAFVASILKRRQLKVTLVLGGMNAWKERKYAVVEEPASVPAATRR
jgi:glyoxylase-like metal-dependent hydrolase (beta-lactamase superfamily II)/rhodanese-related sulfurtransferase